MIFLVTGRIGAGAANYAEALSKNGFLCVESELAKLDGNPVPEPGKPRYCIANPEKIHQICDAFPNELFHIIYIKVDTEDEDEIGRKARYLADCGLPADAAETTFAEQDSAESELFDKFETGFNEIAAKFENFRAMHTITNNFDPTSIQEWADYFHKFHTMYMRTLSLVKLAMKHNVVNTNDAGQVVLILKEMSYKFVSPETFADILISDNDGFAMTMRGVLESATAAELAEI